MNSPAHIWNGKDIELSDRPLIIYHGGCTDGFGAAFAAWLVYRDTADYYPGVYQQDPPDVTGRDVYLVDFSYKRPVIEEMSRKAESITVIDHHKSAMEDLANPHISDEYPNVVLHFNMEHSGAVLAYKFWHATDRIPLFFQLIEDADLWRFALNGTREFTQALRSYAQDFDVWKTLWQFPERLINEGTHILRFFNQKVEEALKNAFEVKWFGEKVLVCNAPYFMSSEVANRLAEGRAFGACYYMGKDGATHYSLRSKEGGADVSEIAKRYGGGGHKHAAGFRSSFTNMVGTAEVLADLTARPAAS